MAMEKKIDEERQGIPTSPSTPFSSGIIPPKLSPGGITWVYGQSKSADPPEQMTIKASETITAEVRTLGDFFNPQQNFKTETKEIKETPWTLHS